MRLLDFEGNLNIFLNLVGTKLLANSFSRNVSIAYGDKYAEHDSVMLESDIYCRRDVKSKVILKVM